jgi:hypothetical protein
VDPPTLTGIRIRQQQKKIQGHRTLVPTTSLNIKAEEGKLISIVSRDVLEMIKQFILFILRQQIQIQAEYRSESMKIRSWLLIPA